MKHFKFQVIFLLAIGLSNTGYAQMYIGSVGNNTTDNTATDIFYIVCTDNCYRATFKICDIPTTPEIPSKISIQAYKAGASPATTAWSTDNSDSTFCGSRTGGLMGFSPQLSIIGGNGAYFFKVNKSKVAGVKRREIYQAHIEFFNKNGDFEPDKTTTFPVYIQNQ